MNGKSLQNEQCKKIGQREDVTDAWCMCVLVQVQAREVVDGQWNYIIIIKISQLWKQKENTEP